MTFEHTSPQRPWLRGFLTHGIVGLFVALLFACIGAPAHAAPPPAGTSISNQASATYSDGSGVARTVMSNLVTTSVTQVYSVLLSANGAQNATPGSVVYYPHTVQNTGNGNDNFNLTVTTGTGGFTMTNVVIYADNGSGGPIGSPITSTGILASGASFKFIVAATLPASASNGQTNALVVTATSPKDATATQPNTDTTTVTSNAVVTLTKGISISSGAPGTTGIVYTLSYTNTGNSDATAVTITDTIPAGMTWVNGGALWSQNKTTPLIDTSAGGVVTATSNANKVTSSLKAGVFTATIDKVAAGESGTISFSVNLNGTGVAPGVINNTAGLQYNNGTPTPVTGSSNTVPFTVNQTAGVTLTGDNSHTTPVAAGSTIVFKNIVLNTGNGTDTFNITTSGSNFPVGTQIHLYKSDGTTPLVDTNGDGTIDTGPVAAGDTYIVYLQAVLPPNASGAGPFQITKTATSTLDKNKTANGDDVLTGGITAASVDLTNKIIAPVTGSAGTGTGTGEATAQGTLTAAPGTTNIFTLVAKNTGPAPDSYDLAVAQSADMATALPAGWSVVFKADGGAGNCSSTGATITNTGSVAINASATFCAFVTIPAGYDAGTVQVYFRTLSPISAASDVLHDAVTVSAVRSLSLTPNGAGQTYPGGSYVYKHTLTNNGNVSEGGSNSTVTPALVNDGTSWSSTLYYDTNGNGALDANDLPVNGALNVTLAKGQSMILFNKVIAPSGAVANTVNNTTITITTTGSGTVPVPTISTDSTSVIAGNLTLVKAQALDATCTGATGSTTYSQGNLNAAPGQCVLYQITVTNVGAADATNVVLSDATPAYTTISAVPATSSGWISPLAVGASGTITANIGTGATATQGGTLGAGQTATITFGVQIAK